MRIKSLNRMSAGPLVTVELYTLLWFVFQFLPPFTLAVCTSMSAAVAGFDESLDVASASDEIN